MITTACSRVQPEIAADGTLSSTAAADANGGASRDGGPVGRWRHCKRRSRHIRRGSQFTISVTAVNDAPTFTAGADRMVDEDSGSQIFSNGATAISAGPSDEAGQTVTFSGSNSNNSLFAVQPAIDSAGTLDLHTGARPER